LGPDGALHLRQRCLEPVPNLKGILDEIRQRPAIAKVNAYRERFTFKAEFDEEARRYMFPQNLQQVR
jgi:GSH-dependent disulfide-bond oxidoreductase